MAELAGWLGHAANLGPTALLAIFILMLLTGRMLPASWVRRLIEIERKRGDDYKAAFDRSEEARKVQDGQINELLEHTRTQGRVLDAVQRLAYEQQQQRQIGSTMTRPPERRPDNDGNA